MNITTKQEENKRDETKAGIMKNPMLAITFCAITAFAVACKPSTDQSASEQLDKIKSETTADAQDMKNYAFADRADFVAKMQGQLDALNKDLDQLSAKIENSGDAVKADAKPKFQALRDHAAQLNKQLDTAKNATASNWDRTKDSSEKGYDALKDDFQQARQWASDKIAL